MASVIDTIIRRDNTNNITYVLKKYNNGTYIMNIYQLVNGCYRLIARQNGNCIG
jgi:hypothetical protein